VKKPGHARNVCNAENIAAVRDSVAEEPSTSTRRRAQQLHMQRSSLIRILHKDLNMHAYKVRLIQELKPTDHLKRRQWSDWGFEIATVNDEFLTKITQLPYLGEGVPPKPWRTYNVFSRYCTSHITALNHTNNVKKY
jgi:hypothetical protein